MSGYLAAAYGAQALGNAYTSYRAGKAEEEDQKKNADFLEKQAKLILANAEREEDVYISESDYELGGFSGAVAKSGAARTDGDLYLLEQSFQKQARTISDIRRAAREEANLLKLKAASARYQGKRAKRAGKLGAGLSLLTGGAAAYTGSKGK